MKILIKVVVLALVVNAMWRIGSVYFSHYRFVDQAEGVVQMKGNRTDAEIHDRVFALATEYGIPVTDANLTITTTGQHSAVKGAYTRSIQPVPGMTYAWPFKVNIEVISSLGPAR